MLPCKAGNHFCDGKKDVGRGSRSDVRLEGLGSLWHGTANFRAAAISSGIGGSTDVRRV